MTPRAMAAVGAAWLVLSGCGSATTGTDQLTAATTTGAPNPASDDREPRLPVTLTDDAGVEVTIESIDRILPVDGDLTEIVYALGLGDQVVATDISATYPPAVDEVPDIGYQRALSAEPIAAMEPTVVLATDLAGPVEVLDQLRQIGIPVVLIDRIPTLDGPADKIQAVADALGVGQRGRALAKVVNDEIALASTDAKAAIANLSTPPRVLPVYLRGDSVQLIMGRGTGIDAVLAGLGVIDVAAELGVLDTRQITAEALLLASPDVLLVTTTGLQSVGGIDGLLSIPGIAETPAGQLHQVLAYEDQYLLGNGPRTGQLMRQLANDLQQRFDATSEASEITTTSP